MGFEEDLEKEAEAVFEHGRNMGFTDGARWAYDYAKQASGWQPIETAPKDGAFVALYDAETKFQFRYDIMKWDSKKGGWSDGYDCYKNLGFTHWAPIPSPPTHDSHRHGSSK